MYWQIYFFSGYAGAECLEFQVFVLFPHRDPNMKQHIILFRTIWLSQSHTPRVPHLPQKHTLTDKHTPSCFVSELSVSAQLPGYFSRLLTSGFKICDQIMRVHRVQNVRVCSVNSNGFWCILDSGKGPPCQNKHFWLCLLSTTLKIMWNMHIRKFTANTASRLNWQCHILHCIFNMQWHTDLVSDGQVHTRFKWLSWPLIIKSPDIDVNTAGPSLMILPPAGIITFLYVHICCELSNPVHYYGKVTDNGCAYRAPLVCLETTVSKI